MGEATTGTLVIGMLVAALVEIGTVVTGSSLRFTAGELISPTGD